MANLFSKRSKGIIKWVWAVIAIIITISMIFAYSGGLSLISSYTS